MVCTPQQEQAMTISGKPLLVSAAAGSGKTSVLTERIIRSLIDPDNPADLSRMLIVTFTRASAADLRSKIAKALTKALAERPADPHLTRQLLGLGSAQISTIDSFFQKTVRAHFDVLDLPATFRIADESESIPLRMRVLSNLLEEHYERGARHKTTKDDPLARVRGNEFAEAMDHLVSGRSDGSLEKILIELYDKFSPYPQGISLLLGYADELTSAAEGEFVDFLPGIRLLSYLKEQYSCAYDFLSKTLCSLEADPDLEKKFCGILTADMEYCKRVMDAIEENNYEKVRDAVYSFNAGRFPSVKAVDMTNGLLAYKAWRDIFKTQITKTYQPVLQWPTSVLSESLRRTASLCRALYSFYADYERDLLREKKTRGILDYNDIRAALYRLLTNEDGKPSDTAKAIAAQYDAVYVDEYQDVDRLQDLIFSYIGGDRLFMVGDIKQSIYGFRGSDPEVFSDYRRQFPLYTEADKDSSAGVCVFMSNNFRCNEPVIDFTNKVCGFLFSACEHSIDYKPQDDLVYSKNDGKANPNDEPVHVAVFDGKPRGKSQDDENETENSELLAEDVWVAREIDRLLREEKLDDGSPIKPSDIAILVRAKAHGIGISRALEALHIPVVSEAANDIMTEPLTVNVLNLLRTIDNPYRDLPLSEYLLSELGGYTLEELSLIRASAPDRKSLFDAMQEKAKEEATELGARCKKFCEWIDTWRDQAATLPADRFLRLLYLDECLIAYQGDPVLLFLYEQARVYQRTAFCGLYAFLDTMQKLQNGSKVSADGFKKAESAVTVMTVHHSKGLEYPVVFLCGCGKGFNKDDMKKRVLFHDRIGCTCKLYNPMLGDVEDNILHSTARLLVEQQQKEESIRTLYVALTRARERLYVTGTLPGGRDTALANADAVTRGDRAAILHCNSYLSWILAALNEKGGKGDYTLEFFTHVPLPLLESEKADEAVPEEAITAPTQPSELGNRYAKILRAQKDFEYPLAFLHGLPTKAAASTVAPDLLDRLAEDGNEDDVSQTQLDLMMAAQPSFDELLLSRDKPTAAEIGTATHAFLQFCDFGHLATDGIDAERERLLSMRYISKESADIVDHALLEKFRQSDLLQELLSAKRIYREQKFNLFVPFSELTERSDAPTALGERSLFVQGSIDLLIETADGDLLLVDYKTDRIYKEERNALELYRNRLRNAHKNQLAYYQRAVRQLFGKKPDQTFIYSIPLGELIKL